MKFILKNRIDTWEVKTSGESQRKSGERQKCEWKRKMKRKNVMLKGERHEEMKEMEQVMKSRVTQKMRLRERAEGTHGGTTQTYHTSHFCPPNILKCTYTISEYFFFFFLKPCGKLYFWTFVFFQPHTKPWCWLWTDLHLHRAFLVVLTTKCRPQYDWKAFFKLNLTQLTQLIKILGHRNYTETRYSTSCIHIQ